MLAQFAQELVHHVGHHRARERREVDHGVQAVAELGGKGALDGLGLLSGAALSRETQRRAAGVGGPGIGGENQNQAASVHLFARVVGQGAVVHQLQEDVVHVGMRLLDFVKEEHRVRVFRHGVGQQPALVEAHVAGRRSDEASHRVRLLVLGHVEADEFHAQALGQRAGEFGFAHPGRPGEQERPLRFLRVAQARAGELDRR